MITYLLQVSFCWIIFYAVYFLLLRKETFFLINRIFLMSTLLIGLFIPQWSNLIFEMLQSGHSEIGQIAHYISETPQLISVTLVPDDTIFHHWKWILAMIYGTGVLITLFRITIGLQQIYSLYNNGKKIPHKSYTLVKTRKPHMPFSFFHYVFLSEAIPLNKNIKEIMAHEISHVKNLHTLDILTTEIIQAIFWFNPILILYKKALRDTHEFAADASVLKQCTLHHYSKILTDQVISGLEMSLANCFFNSPLKNRINMMYKKKSRRSALLKYPTIIPVIFLMAFLFSNAIIPDDKISFDPTSSDKYHQLSKNTLSLVQDNPDRMPRFPGCEDLEISESEKEKCSIGKLIAYLADNITYPDEKEEGVVMVKFVVSKKGKIQNAHIVKGMEEEFNTEALRVVNKMNTLASPWIPGIKDGKTVAVEYVLPISFKLK